MKIPRLTTITFLATALATLGSIRLQAQSTQVTQPPTATSDDTAADQKAIILNPFDVNASTDVGYGAAATSSTSRILQNYVDIPQSVNVVTSEFIEDYNIEDTHQMLQYESNVQFGVNDQPGVILIRGAEVSITYLDGTAMPFQEIAEPFAFFDRVEIIKGPSSVAFGLGQPGGLINYVSKTPQGINSTTFSFGQGGYDNSALNFDTQGISPTDPALSYRLVGFWDQGNYETPREHHWGAGGQLSVRYDLNKTTRFDLITAYSQTSFPTDNSTGQIFQNAVEYTAWIKAANPTSGGYLYLPGTLLNNGSIFGVSGPLPQFGGGQYLNAVNGDGITTTGYLVPLNYNYVPPGLPAYDQNNTFRNELIFTKDLADNHVHLRNALALVYNQDTQYDPQISALFFLPGYTNTLPGVVNGPPIPPYPPGSSGPGTTPPGNFQNSTAWNELTTSQNSASRTDELDINGSFHIFGGDWNTEIGGDLYDNEYNVYAYEQGPAIDSATGNAFWPMYYNPKPGVYYLWTNLAPAVLPTTYGITQNENVHSWGSGYYAQEDVTYAFPTIGSINLLAGWRDDYFDTETRNYAGASTYPGWVTTKGAPRFAATYKPLPWLSVYSLYTKHADPTESTPEFAAEQATVLPQWESLIHKQLYYQPTGVTIEEGMKASFLGGRIYASVAFFHEINLGQVNGYEYSEVLLPNGTSARLEQFVSQGLNAHGLEAEVFGQATPRLSFTINYGSITGRFPDFANTNVPDFENPPTTLSGHLKYDFGNLHGKGFFVTFGGVGYSPYPAQQSGVVLTNPNESVDTYYPSWQYTIDGGIGFRWRNGKYRQQLYFNMDNITNQLVVDASYLTSQTQGPQYPLRQYFLTYKVTF